MANSGIEWIDATFNWCVWILVEVAGRLGISYEEINIWIFVIIWPLFTLLETVVILVLIRKMKAMKRRDSLENYPV